MDKGQSTVTKSPHPGRQASGKRLVEWNRKNKEALLKNREVVEKQDSSGGDKEPNEVPDQVPTSRVLISPWMLVVLVAPILGGVYYFKCMPKPAPQVEAPPIKVKNYME